MSIKEGRLQQGHHLHQHDSQNGGKGITVRGESKANQRCDRNLLSCANCSYLVHRETQYVLQLLHKGLYVKGCFYGQKHGTLYKRLTELAYTR